MPTTHLLRRRRSISAAIATVLLTAVAAYPVAADSTAQTPPIRQDWHDTSLITANDDWSGVPGFVGHLGQDITTSPTPVDPQTLLTDSTVANDVDVMANLLEPNINNGGVGEFDSPVFFPDPVVAIQPSNVADAPYLLLNIRTTGLSDVPISYDLRDIDDTADNAVQPVALQYRVGATGLWTNIPAGFVADATTGPVEATLVTPVSTVLPPAANDQPLVQIRIITSNASGNDEWVGIDNIKVGADLAPTVISTNPGDGATDVARDANVSVTFSEPVTVAPGGFSIACSKTFAHAASISGGPVTFTLDPVNDFAYDESCTLTVFAQNVSDQDTDDPADLMTTDHVTTFQTVAPPPPPDQAPSVQSTSPDDGATDIARDANLSVTFDEPVDVSGAWFDITCASSHDHSATVSGGPLTFTLDPDADFAYGESCTFTVTGSGVSDQDTNDPPDTMAGDNAATFQTVAKPPDPPKPPTVDAGGPYDVVAGGSVDVTATGSQPDGQTLTYRWDLDHDGTFETPGQTATFSAAGLSGPTTRTIAVQVTAPTGLTATDDATVNVSAAPHGFDFKGFKGVDALPSVNDANLGTQFIRFSLDGNQGLDIFEDGHPTTASYPCGTTPPSDASEPAQQQGASGFRYDPGSDEYTFKWNVDKSWKNTCRVFVLGLSDGSTHNLAFHFGSSTGLISAKH